MMPKMPTVAELAAQLDDLGWTLVMRCECHVWRAALMTAADGQVEATDPDWLTAIVKALAAAHAQLARRGYTHG